MNASSLSSLLQRFFTDRLLKQMGASSQTVSSYRDTFRLLFQFAADQIGREPSKLHMEELDVSFLEKFLEHLEIKRHNCARTRNNRLSALKAFFRYVSFTEPALAMHCQRILVIPSKRYEHGPVEFLTEEETAALIAAPDPRTWIGRRDQTILLVAVQTGLRNSEITALRREDVEFGTGAHVRCQGKGRKMRCTPLRPDVVAMLKEWLSLRDDNPHDPVFPTTRGTRLSADALQRLITRHAVSASQSCPSLKEKTVTPHTLRHSAAMNLLQHGVDLSVIALWLGHESIETTQIYLDADLVLKEKILARTIPFDSKPGKYRPDDRLLAFLNQL